MLRSKSLTCHAKPCTVWPTLASWNSSLLSPPLCVCGRPRGVLRIEHRELTLSYGSQPFFLTFLFLSPDLIKFSRMSLNLQSSSAASQSGVCPRDFCSCFRDSSLLSSQLCPLVSPRHGGLFHFPWLCSTYVLHHISHFLSWVSDTILYGFISDANTMSDVK